MSVSVPLGLVHSRSGFIRLGLVYPQMMVPFILIEKSGEHSLSLPASRCRASLSPDQDGMNMPSPHPSRLG